MDRYATLDLRFFESGADMQAPTTYALWDKVDVTPALHRGRPTPDGRCANG